MTLAIHLHAFVALAWFALLATQPFLIRSNRLALHRALDLASIALMILFFFTALRMMRNSYTHGILEMPREAVLSQLAQSFTALSLFLLFCTLALVRANNSFKPNLLRYTNNVAGKATLSLRYASRLDSGVRRLSIIGTQMKRLLLVALLAISFTASAVAIRSDVKDAKYRVPASAFPALVDMPGEGHGVLIAPQWVVTAAHAAPMQGMEGEVSIGGVARRVKRVITYPGYKKMPDQLVKEALASGDLSRVYAFLASSNDIALVELASPVTDVAPVSLYHGDKEVGMTVQLVGKGATGNGVEGQVPHSSHRTVLRRAFNVIVGTDARYVWYRFDPPSSALPLEGITGSGDSGGPLLIGGGSSKQLVGLGSWSKYPPDHPFWSKYAQVHPFQEGLYGQIVYGVRISSYIQWIEGVISAPASARTQLPPAGAANSIQRTRHAHR